MADTFSKIASVTVASGGVASITFSSISSSYTDLQLFLSARVSGSAPYAGIYVSFNGDTGSSTLYSMTLIEGYGGVSSSKSTSIDTLFPVPHVDANTATSNTFGNASMYFPNYSGSDFKTISINAATENNSTATYDYDLGVSAGYYASTSAINTIKVQPNNPFVQYTTATLYGISKS
jgi:hypothetical protein